MPISRHYDFTWYDKPHMAVTEGMGIGVVADLWCVRFGTTVCEDQIAGDFFYEGATMRLLRAGWILKQVSFDGIGRSNHKITFKFVGGPDGS